MFTPGTCDDTFLRRGEFYCGCPDAEQQCSLCADNEEPANLSKKDNYVTNSDCAGTTYLFSLFSADECSQGVNFGVNYRVFCGCPGEPTSTESCDLCEDGKAPKDLNKVYNDQGRTCGEAYEITQAIQSDGLCSEIKEGAAKECCSGAPAWNIVLGAFLAAGAAINLLL